MAPLLYFICGVRLQTKTNACTVASRSVIHDAVSAQNRCSVLDKVNFLDDRLRNPNTISTHHYFNTRANKYIIFWDCKNRPVNFPFPKNYHNSSYGLKVIRVADFVGLGVAVRFWNILAWLETARGRWAQNNCPPRFPALYSLLPVAEQAAKEKFHAGGREKGQSRGKYPKNAFWWNRISVNLCAGQFLFPNRANPRRRLLRLMNKYGQLYYHLES